jgi:hypothetical protein
MYSRILAVWKIYQPYRIGSTAAKNWNKRLVGQLKQRIGQLRKSDAISAADKQALTRILTSRVVIQYGEAQRITIKFPLHGVFWHKGVGRGAPAGSTGRRTPAPWFNPVLDDFLPELADILADYQADLGQSRALAAVNVLNIK